MVLRRVLLALYVATAAALAVFIYVPDHVRVGSLYVLLVLTLPLSLLIAIALWVAAYLVNIVVPGAATTVVPIMSVVYWTLGALGNALLVRWTVRAFRGAPEPPAEPVAETPTEAAGP